jgi:hypothetical protein
VDAGAADLAAGAQRRDDHLISLPSAGGRALPSRWRAARSRGGGRHGLPLPESAKGLGFCPWRGGRRARRLPPPWALGPGPTVSFPQEFSIQPAQPDLESISFPGVSQLQLKPHPAKKHIKKCSSNKLRPLKCRSTMFTIT